MTGGFGEKAKAKKAKKTLVAAGKRMRPAKSMGRVEMTLTPAELEILKEALDSHIYWQLSDEAFRKDGFVLAPGCEHPEDVEILKEADALLVKLGGQSMLDGDGAQ